MSKKGDKKRKQQEVITVALKKQEQQKVNIVVLEKALVIEVKRYVKSLIILFIGILIIFAIYGLYTNHKNQKASKAAVIQHTKEEMYRTYLDSQWQMITELKEYRNTKFQQWKDCFEYEEGFRTLYITTEHGDKFTISNSEVDKLIEEHANEIEWETQYEKIIPEFSYGYELFDPWEKKFPDHLSDLENLALKFPTSYGVNNSIRIELEDKHKKIEQNITDKVVLERVWALEKECSKNLKDIEKLLEIEE